MSRIADMAKQMKEAKEKGDAMEPLKRHAVSMRIDDFTRFCLDKFVEVAGGTKTALCQELVAEGVLEGFEALGTNLDDLRVMYIAERSGKSIEEVQSDYDQTGIFVDGKRAELREDGVYVDGKKVEGE